MPPPLVLAGAEPGIDPVGAVPEILLLVAIAAFVAIGALSHESTRHFSAALVYLAMGAAGAVLLSRLGLQRLDLVRDHRVLEVVTDVTIAVAVFATGLRIRRSPPRRWRTLVLLLLVTMPLTAAAVAFFATTAMGLPVAAAIVLGAALAPTDPVLAGDIGLGPPSASEDEPRARAAITAEAGANDGAAMPMLVLGLLLAEDGDLGRFWTWFAADLLYAVAISVAVGVALGAAGSVAFVRMRERDLLDPGFEGWAAVATALLIYAVAELLGGYGFVAGFVGGLAFRRGAYDDPAPRAFHDGAEVAENVLTLTVLLLLGSALTLEGLGEPGVAGWLLAPLLLFVVRPATVMLALIGSGIPTRERLYVAWFGVKGVAAVNYATVTLTASVLSGGDARTVLWTATVCVIVSIALHGTSSTALTRRLLGPSVGGER